MHAQNVVKLNPSNIVLKDAFSRIGLNCINSNAQDNNRKHVTPFYSLMFKELKHRHRLLKKQMMEVYLHQINKKWNKYWQA